MKMKSFLFALLSSVAVSNANASCPTHITCSANTPCKCTVMASSAYDRYFYFDIHDIGKGATYQCDFASSPTRIMAVVDKSTFPQGSQYTITNGGYAPYSIKLDTKDMTKPADTMIVKFLVFASDYPSDVSASCKVIS